MKNCLKILFVGNSFAVDTMEHAANVAKNLGIEKLKFATLFNGGCSIDLHYEYAMNDTAAYDLFLNEGEGWEKTPEYKMSDAIKSDTWDWIAIQHGTRGPSRYTSPECYEKLTPLISYIKSLASGNPKIAFNLTWLGESTRVHHEIISYGGNMKLMRQKLEEVTKEVILGNPNVDMLVPTGTAIENARTSDIGLLTRDCYHLSMDKGRYIAALTFISAISGIDAANISWAPEGVDGHAMKIAVKSAQNAIKAPLSVTTYTP